MTHIARGSFTVALVPVSFEGAEPEWKLGRLTIDKVIQGDLEASTRGQMLSAMTEVKGSAGYVAIERVSGTLHGRRGSFALQHTGVMNRGVPTLSVLVVPDSGTGELEGISGEFRILQEGGAHRYEFAYQLPEGSRAS